jgi:dCMP deaminase
MHVSDGQDYYKYMSENTTPKIGPRPRKSWEEYALGLAFKAAEDRSEDPYCQVGACVLRKRDRSVGGIGYNGPPPGVELDWSDRDARRPYIVHAEINALAHVEPGECDLMAVTMLPCSGCMPKIARYGIKKIVYSEVYKRDPLALEMAKKFGIELVQIQL